MKKQKMNRKAIPNEKLFEADAPYPVTVCTHYHTYYDRDRDVITIGTVTQKPDTVADTEVWDAER